VEELVAVAAFVVVAAAALLVVARLVPFASPRPWPDPNAD